MISTIVELQKTSN